MLSDEESTNWSWDQEAKAYFWSLKYPVSYTQEPSKQPGTGDVINAVNVSGRRSQYVPAPALNFGFGYAF